LILSQVGNHLAHPGAPCFRCAFLIRTMKLHAGTQHCEPGCVLISNRYNDLRVSGRELDRIRRRRGLARQDVAALPGAWGRSWPGPPPPTRPPAGLRPLHPPPARPR
jgi:hypothetical protein